MIREEQYTSGAQDECEKFTQAVGLERQLEADGLVGVIRHEVDVQVVVCRLDNGGGARPAQTPPDGGRRDVWTIPQLE